jgi:4-amino-4-deoxy-L-arabinose transferase-like glycosyltransferase
MNRTSSLSPSILISLAALLLMASNCVLAIHRTGLTSDEVIHIAAGYYSLSAGEYRMNAEHPPLAKMWSALPLMLFLPHDEGPANAPGNFSQRGGQYYGHFWNVYQDAYLRICFWARTAMVAFTVALGSLIFVATRRWFGPVAAVFAVLLYTFEPTVLGHGRLVHTDIPATLMYLLFFVALDQYRERLSISRALVVGFVTALALLTKFSMIILLPVAGAFFIVRFWRTRGSSNARWSLAGHLSLASLVFVLTIQAVYAFRNPPLEPEVKWIQSVSRYPVVVERTIETLSPLFPRDFLFGIYVVTMHNSGGHSASVLGNYDYRGWWYYFPVAFLLKTFIPFLLLSVAAIVWSLRRVTHGDRSLWYALIPLALYSAMAMTSGINIGVRHFLPAFPFLFMLSGAFLAAVSRDAPKAGGILAAGVISLMAIEAVATFPYYISYVNQLKGQNPGWRYLSDSNVEWGDATPELAAYLKARGVNQVSGALLGGNLTLHAYGIEFMDLFGRPPRPQTQYVALGASFLNGSTVEYGDASNGRETELQRINFFDAYRSRRPVAVFGNSIYLFENPDIQSDNPGRTR